MTSPSRLRFVVALGAMAGACALGALACDLDQDGAGDVGDDGGADVIALDVRTDVARDASGADGARDGEAIDAADANDGAILDAPPDTCAPLETDCLDGVDNDCNGVSDCADPACQAGYACVPSAPTGWTGYALYDDDRTTPCPTDYPAQDDTFESFVAPPASCSACTCAGATGATCGTTATLSCAATAACNAGGTTEALNGAACSDFGSPLVVGTTDFCEVTPPGVTAGSCAPSGGALNRPAPSFGTLSRVCGGGRTGGGCDSTHVCALKPTGAAHGACIAQAVNGAAVICPAGYTHAHTVSLDGGITDTRACTSCSCGPASAGGCAGLATLHTQAGCTDPADDAGISIGGGPTAPITIAADGACHTGLVTGAETFASGELAVGAPVQGTCAPDGGKLTGTATVTAQTVYCCQN